MQNQTAAQLLPPHRTDGGARTDGRPARPKGSCCWQIAVLGAYLKRRSNLIFLSEGQGGIPAAELSHCLRESLQNLTLFGITADQSCSLTGELSLAQIDALLRCVRTDSGGRPRHADRAVCPPWRRKGTRRCCRLRLCCKTDFSRNAGGRGRNIAGGRGRMAALHCACRKEAVSREKVRIRGYLRERREGILRQPAERDMLFRPQRPAGAVQPRRCTGWPSR
jgi:hypothetical protein